MTYVITPEKQALFDTLLDLLKEFNRVCSENDITYYAFGGTMLGAIRHHGFIPWDDDLDVIVPRKDYEKLKQVANEGAFKDPFFFQNPSTDKGYPKGFCRLRNSKTTEIPFQDVAMNCNRGIFIDIFPLDILPDDDKQKEKQKKKLQHIRLLMNSYARYYSGFGVVGTTKIKKVAYYVVLPLFLCNLLTTDKLFRKSEKIASKYVNYDYKKAGAVTLLFENDRFIYDSNLWRGKTIWCDFESVKIPVPEEFDSILKHSYGDYMTPVQEPTNHGELLFSTTIPYDEYIKENYSVLKENWYKQTEIEKKRRAMIDNTEEEIHHG